MGFILVALFVAGVFVYHFVAGRTRALTGRQLRGELNGLDNDSR